MTSAVIEFAINASAIITAMGTLFVLWRAAHNSARRLEEELFEAQAAMNFAVLMADQSGLEFLRGWQRDDEKALHASYPHWRVFRDRYVRQQLILNA